MNINLINKDDIKDIILPENIDKVYLIDEDKGYIFLLNNPINKIYILIKKEYRGNGYGTKSLEYALKQYNEELIFETSNPIVERMLTNIGGINVGRDNGISRIQIYVNSQ